MPKYVVIERLSFRTWLALLALALIIWMIITYAGIIVAVGWVLFGAFLLSLPIGKLADLLTRYHIPRSVSVLASYVLLLGLVVALGNMLVPLIRSEVDSMREDGPALLDLAGSRLADTPLAGVTTSLTTVTSSLARNVDAIVPGIVATLANVGGVAVDLLILLILSYLFAIDTTAGHSWFSRWFDPARRQQIDAVWRSAEERLTRWVWAQAAIAVYFAVVFGVGLSVLHVPYAVTIGVAGGLLEIVPYLGGITAVVLAVVSALTVNVWTAVWVVVFYMVVAAVESHIIAPYFYGRAIGLRSAWVLIALVLGAKAEGLLGVLFAVPVAVVASAVLREIYRAAADTGTKAVGSND